MVTAIAALIAWFAAKKVDDILGKWVAYFTIAWENAATGRAKRSYREKVAEVQNEMVDSFGSWDDWRKKAGIT